MRYYEVELVGEAREVYIVQADTDDEARRFWPDGWQKVSEASGMEIVSVVPLTSDEATP